MARGSIARTCSNGQGAGLDLAVDALLADAARDELRVLGAEVEDEDELAGRRRHG